MQIFFYIILGIIAGLIVSRLVMSWKRKAVMKVGSMALADINKEKHTRKEMKKGRIMEMMKKKKIITNDEVERLVNVSDATATRYLDELEDEGKIEQKGKGAGAFYNLR